MEARLICFGEVELDGRRYEHDVVIAGGVVHRRRKGPSKSLRGQYGHTPLSVREAIPWGGRRLIVGTGVDGQLPIAAAVFEEAAGRDIEIVALPTEEACRLLGTVETAKVRAILHISC